ncbi:hypothetical protein NESM_000718700 [Novymonas esmeraldas]|uniref:Uncharacterized protein n=1 Tax=Novymonas esmeraldas TaxID=1808958 RepID=A0AAW0ETR2_9TRYP
MTTLEKKDIISTPVPFPTIPIKAPPRSQRSWIENNWWVLLILECVILFAAFVGLLVYYLCYVRTPGKRLLDDRVDNDGLSHYGSELASSSRASSVASKRSFTDSAAGGMVDGARPQRSASNAAASSSAYTRRSGASNRRKRN